MTWEILEANNIVAPAYKKRGTKEEMVHTLLTYEEFVNREVEKRLREIGMMEAAGGTQTTDAAMAMAMSKESGNSEVNDVAQGNPMVQTPVMPNMISEVSHIPKGKIHEETIGVGPDGQVVTKKVPAMKGIDLSQYMV